MGAESLVNTRVNGEDVFLGQDVRLSVRPLSGKERVEDSLSRTDSFSLKVSDYPGNESAVVVANIGHDERRTEEEVTQCRLRPTQDNQQSGRADGPYDVALSLSEALVVPRSRRTT